MIVCRECGHSNAADDVFCGSCGSFLEWVGERVETDEPEAAPAVGEAVADDTRPGLIDRVKAMVGLEDHEGASGGEPAPGSTVRLEPQRGQQEPGARAESERAAREAVQAEAERAAREAADAERAAREAAEAEARARAEQQARRQAELDARAKAEAEAHAAAEARAREQAQRASREEAEQAAREAEQVQAREAAEAQARERAEAQARHRDEAAAKTRAESAARREAEQAADRARRAAALVAKQEAAASPPVVEPRPEPARPTRPVRRQPQAVVSDAATAEAPCPPVGPGAQQPTAQRRKTEPRTLQPPTRRIEPGELVCGSCGEGNAPSRNFCRRCGQPLADATVARIPWWRRVFRRRRKVAPAGTRPGRTARAAAGGSGDSRARVAWRGVQKAGRRGMSLMLAAAAILALVGAFVPAARPWRAAVVERVEGVYDAGRRLVSPRYVNVYPVQATASSHLPSREPGLAIDRIKDFSWAEGAPGDGVGQRLIVTFAEPVDIHRVGFYSGSSEDPEAFTAQPRPKDLHLVFSDGSSSDVTLNDTWEFQPFGAGGRQVTEVVIRIDSVYGPTPDGACAIREVEFFTKA